MLHQGLHAEVDASCRPPVTLCYLYLLFNFTFGPCIRCRAKPACINPRPQVTMLVVLLVPPLQKHGETLCFLVNRPIQLRRQIKIGRAACREREKDTVDEDGGEEDNSQFWHE